MLLPVTASVIPDTIDQRGTECHVLYGGALVAGCRYEPVRNAEGVFAAAVLTDVCHPADPARSPVKMMT
jgi:hypothetical protein